MSNSDSKTTKSFLSLTPSLTALRIKGFMLLNFSSFLLLESSYFSFLERMFRMLSLTYLLPYQCSKSSNFPATTPDSISPTDPQCPQVGDQGKEEKPRGNKDSCQKLFFLTLRNALSSVQLLIMSDSLWPHEPQHARPPCPSPTPRVHPNPCPLSRWCHPTISYSVVPFSSCPQSFAASRSFQMSQLFASGVAFKTGKGVSYQIHPGPKKCLIHRTQTWRDPAKGISQHQRWQTLLCTLPTSQSSQNLPGS